MIVRCALSAMALGTLLVSVSGAVRLNTTDSVPIGFYRVRQGMPVRRGTLALVCLPEALEHVALGRGYLGPGDCPGSAEPVLKPVAAVAGDVVEVSAAGVSVNGVLIVSAALTRDSAGRGVAAVPPGTYAVPEGSLWLLSGHNSRSWDSRYWGPVPAFGVRGEAQPLAVLP